MSRTLLDVWSPLAYGLLEPIIERSPTAESVIGQWRRPRPG
ncbi:hypothetical protein [Pseudomonas abietaniphila]|nr:hypothetical protein [Pseudomonas abietaniphila]